jgi:hypothetical protein
MDNSASQLSTGGATTGGGAGDTLGNGGTTGGGTLGSGGMNKKPEQHDNFRSHNVRFLQEQNKEVNRALDQLESERDEALAKVQKWEERKHQLQVEYASLSATACGRGRKVWYICSRDSQAR